MENKKKSLSLLLKNKAFAILSIIFFIVIINALFFESSSDLEFFGLLGVYIGVVLLYKVSSKLTFIFCVVLLIIMYIQYMILGSFGKTEKTAVWLFLFFACGIFQKWKE